ncbi:kinase-like protein, partial [Fomes fomentarius]
SPAPRYPGWLSAVVAPLKGVINDQIDPRKLYADLREIAEGSSVSVYAARVLAPQKKSEEFVAIKNIAIMSSGTPKIDDFHRELALMEGGIPHLHILTMGALYVDLVEDSLWVRMELMERSVAIIIALAEEGVQLDEQLMAQIAKDVVQALYYLQSRGIAHRDVRSDNLLVNRDGIVKLADFSNAVQVTKHKATCNDAVGVIYWQAPEMRGGSYNALKVDGATVWELAEAEPPFSDVTDPRQLGTELPPLNEPDIYSQSFHDLLKLCSRSSASRPDPPELLTTRFLRNPSGRQATIDLLADCRDIEEPLSRRQSTDSTGTVSQS